MTRLLALALVLLAPALARANAAVPGVKYVRHHHVFQLDREYPEYAFFLSGLGPEWEPLPLRADTPLRVIAEGGRYDWYAVEMVAVPREALAELNGANPTGEWLRKHEGKVLWSERIPFREDMRSWYSPDEAETEHRVSIADGKVRLETVSEKRSRSWLGSAVAAGALLSAGIAGLGFWVIRRRVRRVRALKPA
jgi:hypothetical protein